MDDPTTVNPEDPLEISDSSFEEGIEESPRSAPLHPRPGSTEISPLSRPVRIWHRQTDSWRVWWRPTVLLCPSTAIREIAMGIFLLRRLGTFSLFLNRMREAKRLARPTWKAERCVVTLVFLFLTFSGRDGPLVVIL
ncbi:hypothetical protein Bca101_058859 [Brassica carinata]